MLSAVCVRKLGENAQELSSWERGGDASLHLFLFSDCELRPHLPLPSLPPHLSAGPDSARL